MTVDSNEYIMELARSIDIEISCIESLPDEWVHARRLDDLSHGRGLMESVAVQGIHVGSNGKMGRGSCG